MNWLVLAKHDVIPSERIIAASRQTMTDFTAGHGGEYDGWEADVKSSTNGAGRR